MLHPQHEVFEGIRWQPDQPLYALEELNGSQTLRLTTATSTAG